MKVWQGVFFQVLESERAEVTKLYARIQADPHHKDLESLHCQSISARGEGDGTMAYLRLSDVDPKTNIDWPEFDPYSPSDLSVMARIVELIAQGRPVWSPPL